VTNLADALYVADRCHLMTKFQAVRKSILTALVVFVAVGAVAVMAGTVIDSGIASPTPAKAAMMQDPCRAPPAGSCDSDTFFERFH
jgi:cytochrome bd-type quinol oxidase subunit 1